MANISDVAGKFEITGPDVKRLGYKKIALFMKELQDLQDSFIDYAIYFGDFHSYTEEEISNMSEEDAKTLLTDNDHFTATGRWVFSNHNLVWFTEDPKYLDIYRNHDLKDLNIDLDYDEIEPGAWFIEADSMARINILYNEESDSYEVSVVTENNVYDICEEGLKKMKYLGQDKLEYCWSYLPFEQLDHEQIAYFLGEDWLWYAEDDKIEFKDGILYKEGKPYITKKQQELNKAKEF